MIINRLDKKHIFFGHFGFWSVILFIHFSFDIFYPSENSMKYFNWKIVSNLFFIFSFYVAYAILVPVFTKKDRFIFKLLKFGIVYFALISLYIVYIKYINEQVYGRPINKFYSYFLNAVSYSSLYLFLGAFFRLAINGLKVLFQKSQLEKQNLKVELALLRSQINPHFLFNTLNNIYSLVLQ